MFQSALTNAVLLTVQVLEEDTQIVPRDEEPKLSGQQLTANTDPGPAPHESFGTAQAAANKGQAKATGRSSVLDCVAELSSVLDQQQPSNRSAVPKPLAEGSISTHVADHKEPKKSLREGKGSAATLLDAILGDDDDEDYRLDAAQAKDYTPDATQAETCSGQDASHGDNVRHTAEQVAMPVTSDVSRQDLQADLPSQHHDVPQSADESAKVSAQQPSGPAVKSRLRDRVKALGLLKK